MSIYFSKYRLLILLFVILFIQGCMSIQDTRMARFFHNVTAHYNIYFNAHERYLDVVEQTENSWVDDYNQILSVYRFPNESSAKTNVSDVDEIVKKCTKILDKHKVSNWIDDSYFLIARSYFYKGDYFAAIEAFQYIINEYSGSNLADESMIWLAKCNFQLKKYDQSFAILSQIKSQGNMPEGLVKELSLLEAQLNILQKDYVSAIEKLKAAIPKETKKYNKTRYLFIISQLYQKTNSFPLAIEGYEKVITRNPPYDMAFNAKIEVSHCFDVVDEKTARPIQTRLTKMLSDDKNIQYLDQIYFELALIDLKLGHKKSAEENLKLCLQNSKNNETQKAFAYLKLAEYYFESQSYKLSKSYYDSSAMFLNESYAGYKELRATNQVLGELVKHLVTVETEDSLLFLASSTTKSRDSIIDLAWQAEEKAKQDAEIAAQQKKVQEEQDMRFNRDMMMSQNRNFMQPPGMGGDLTSSSNWYFYNQSSVNLGKSEFAVKWGKRKLEDDWRRKQKANVIEEDEMAADSVEEEVIEAVLTEEDKKIISEQLKNIPKQKQKYYMDIPFTVSQKEASHKRILESLKKIGDIYLEQLHDTVNSSAAYENLLARYNNSKYDAQTHYVLYKVYNPLSFADRKQAHKDTILRKYPESDYAVLIKDPAYFSRMATTKSKEVKELYEKAYAYYRDDNCPKLLESVAECNTKFKGSHQQIYFEYLKVLCVGKQSPKEDFVTSLEAFQKKSRNKELNAHAENLINYLKGGLEVKKEGTIIPEKQKVDSFMMKTPFKPGEGQAHYFIYFFDGKKTNTSDLKTSFSEYNASYHGTENLSINTLVIREEITALLVQGFGETDLAMKYMKGIQTDREFLTQIKTTKPQLALITQENLTILINEKNIKEYLEFFRKSYN